MCEEQLNEIVTKVEKSYGIKFSPDEAKDARYYTDRKIQLNGKGEDYFPILFENELRDLYTRKIINSLGGMNLCSCRN